MLSVYLIVCTSYLLGLGSSPRNNLFLKIKDNAVYIGINPKLCLRGSLPHRGTTFMCICCLRPTMLKALCLHLLGIDLFICSYG